MEWKDVASIVGKSAPLLGTVLGGPAGAAIGSLVAAALGTGGTPDDVSAAIAADPQAALKLREIELANQVQLQSLALDTTKVILADVQDARSRDVELAKLGRHNTRADVMVISAAVGLLACLLSLVLYREKIPPEAVGIISTIAGLFGACLKDAFSFEFGSSRSSMNKDATISNLSK
jgi:uncharacterized membrane protein YeaQ/YmgE (transglycosylase-associated protein family)